DGGRRARRQEAAMIVAERGVTHRHRAGPVGQTARAEQTALPRRAAGGGAADGPPEWGIAVWAVEDGEPVGFDVYCGARRLGGRRGAQRRGWGVRGRGGGRRWVGASAPGRRGLTGPRLRVPGGRPRRSPVRYNLARSLHPGHGLPDPAHRRQRPVLARVTP